MNEHTKWNSQPTYSIKDVAYFLNTAPTNISTLIKLGIIRSIKLKSVSVPQFEIERFMQDNLGKDLSHLISDEQEKQRALKEGREILNIEN
ncbi:hypothetical protein BGL41_04560 [Fructilactobacillus sanfranciscensis]|uniref:hypothetical protein n=1 Tax=Fructilactobacillus sanfranciscensis TaxID=1625 RepID=UPI000CD3DF9D|nr:hypothetical protein [Fructilactobacillus sanfranciscensis]POH13398.1 hypothetical protein BGL41_04560 [Fructilactobacillus sanfranciscensis]